MADKREKPWWLQAQGLPPKLAARRSSSWNIEAPSGARYTVDTRRRGVTEPLAGIGVLIYAVSWVIHALAFRGQSNVIVTGSKGTDTRGGIVRHTIVDVLPYAEARLRAAEVADAIRDGRYDPWPAQRRK